MNQPKKVIAATQQLIKSADILDIPIIITEQYPKGLGSTIAEITTGRIFYKSIQKTTFSAYSPELKEALKKLGRKQLVVAGMESHVCVWQTVRDLVQDSYSVHLAQDAIASRTEVNYLNGLALMKDQGAVVSNTETIIFDWLKDANRPDFKAISQLIK